MAAAVSYRTGLPLVISLHGSGAHFAGSNRLYTQAVGLGFRRAVHIATCSQNLYDRALFLGADAARTSVIPYGVDAVVYRSGDGARMRARLGIPAEAPVIGALGRLVHKKGFRHLIAAMPAVLRAFPDAYCVIGGMGDLWDELRDRARQAGLTERVLFPGEIDWQDTAHYYAMCDVVAVPSVVDSQGNVDGLPNVLLEAMASGSAVVASRVAGIPLVVQDDRNGLLLPPGDVPALSQALIRLLQDGDTRRRLAAAGQAYIREHHTWEQAARQYEAVYQSAMALSTVTPGTVKTDSR